MDNLAAQLAGAESESVNAASARLRASLELERSTPLWPKGRRRPNAARRSLTSSSRRSPAIPPPAPRPTTPAPKRKKNKLAAHAAELQALGQTASGLTEQREKLTASLSDAQMQRLTCEKDVGLPRSRA